MLEGYQPYIRQANYYETDRMGIIHHSNYIRWFEEARLDYMEQAGFGYDKMEQMGILSPVVGVSADYKAAVTFPDTVIIKVNMTYFNGIKMNLSYEVWNRRTNVLCTTGESRHCFVGKEEFRPLSLKKQYKEIYEIFLACI